MVEKGPSRRAVLKAIGASSMVAGTAAVPVAGKDSRSDVEVEEVTGSDRRELLSRVFSDRRTWSVIRNGPPLRTGSPTIDEAFVYYTNAPTETWYTAVVPFAVESPGNHVYLLWSNNDDYETQVSLARISRNRTAAGEPTWTITETLPGGESITAEEVTIADLTGGDGEATTQILGCSDPNWGCILSTAGAYAGTIGACGTCAGSSGWLVPACASCIGTILGSAGLTISCEWCND